VNDEGADNLRVFFSTTDHSGDQHAAAVIEAIRARRPEAEFAGVGGPCMAQAGCRLLVDATQASALWFHALRDAPRWIRRVRAIRRFWTEWRPDVFVPIDSPGLNFPLAKRARRLGIGNVYYIPPQVWAWGRWRLRKLRRLFKRLLVALPFERDFYGNRGLAVEYVGHPLFDYLPKRTLTADLHGQLGLGPDEPIAGLLPGSRRQEIRRHMPILRDAATIIRERRPDVRFAVGAADPDLVPEIEAALKGAGIESPVLIDRTLELMRDARLCLVASGTATLQLVHFATPMVVVYRLNWVEWLMMTAVKRSRFIGLVNVLAGRELAPEHVLWRDDPERVAASALAVLTDDAAHQRMTADLTALRETIDQPGAVDRAAEAIIDAAES